MRNQILTALLLIGFLFTGLVQTTKPVNGSKVKVTHTKVPVSNGIVKEDKVRW